jgi:hypothetical protein
MIASSVGRDGVDGNSTNSRRAEKQEGFTLVELSLSMTFLTFIMLFVVFLIIQMVNIYNKSVSLGQMNQAGRQIMTDVSSSTRFAAPNSIVVSDPVSDGRLCIGGTGGSVSYIWNVGESTVNKYADASGIALRLVRVRPPAGQKYDYYCQKSNTGTYQAPNLRTGSNLATVIVGPNVLVQEFAPTKNGSVLNIRVALSTKANPPQIPKDQDGNPQRNTDGSLNMQCGDNNFCAFITYDFNTYQRGKGE